MLAPAKRGPPASARCGTANPGTSGVLHFALRWGPPVQCNQQPGQDHFDDYADRDDNVAGWMAPGDRRTGGVDPRRGQQDEQRGQGGASSESIRHVAKRILMFRPEPGGAPMWQSVALTRSCSGIEFVACRRRLIREQMIWYRRRRPDQSAG